jgi:hypothetical protein
MVAPGGGAGGGPSRWPAAEEVRGCVRHSTDMGAGIRMGLPAAGDGRACVRCWVAISRPRGFCRLGGSRGEAAAGDFRLFMAGDAHRRRLQLADTT